MAPDHVSEDSDTAYDTHYCSMAEAMKLITHPFDGDKKRLREFVENVDVALQLMHPSKHDILLKFVKTKITGDARPKLIIRALTHTWALVKGILEENYAVRRTPGFMHAECLVLDKRNAKMSLLAKVTLTRCRLD
ncbi:hypothetical protein Cfor_00438 [Coptotermes formosanus]|uniref:Uncharacterized protein n=1 Tax=Coptotermes formosanus TaxID=36987 RepID=A0A6L2Q1C2_COPFO|nr:hypothetical protein Cfor_00438 [Coptotermes formosanus]